MTDSRVLIYDILIMFFIVPLKILRYFPIVGILISIIFISDQSISGNRVAFIIPVHPPYFKYLDKFLKSLLFHKIEADCIIVFSNHHDKDEWNTLYSTNSTTMIKNASAEIIHIIVDLNNRGNNPPLVKKFTAIYRYHQKYEYFFITDSEISVVKHINIQKACEFIYSRKKIYGTHYIPNDLVFSINNASMIHFTTEDQKKLLKINENNRINFWYNEVPLVKTEYAIRFLDYIGFTNSSIHPSREFDYIAYCYWLLLYTEFKLYNMATLLIDVPLPLPKFYSIGEEGGGPFPFVLVTDPFWMWRIAYLRNKDRYSTYPHIFLTFHDDREQLWD